jgi:hypothetical protein
MRSSPKLAVLALVMAIALAGVACGSREAALRSQGSLDTSTTEAASTSLVAPSTSVVAVTTTTSVKPVVTTTPPITVTTTSGSGVKGTVVFGPVCPVERIPPEPQCAPRPGPADIQLVRSDVGVVAQGRAGSDGQFVVAAAPGRYTVKASATSPSPGRGCQAEPEQVTVIRGSMTQVAVTCDTGIR